MTSAMQGDWRGQAFLTIANGVAPARRREYEAWHSFEHVPERLTMPGFLAGKRYVAGRGAATRYLTVYDLDHAAAVETAAYRHLLAHPTPASLAMRPAMTDFLRGLYRESGKAGAGLARHLGWLSWRGAPQSAFLDLAGRDGIASVRLGTSVATAPHPAFTVAPGDDGEHHMVLLGGTERPWLRHVVAGIAAVPGIAPGVIAHGVVDLILAY